MTVEKFATYLSTITGSVLGAGRTFVQACAVAGARLHGGTGLRHRHARHRVPSHH